MSLQHTHTGSSTTLLVADTPAHRRHSAGHECCEGPRRLRCGDVKLRINVPRTCTTSPDDQWVFKGPADELQEYELRLPNVHRRLQPPASRPHVIYRGTTRWGKKRVRLTFIISISSGGGVPLLTLPAPRSWCRGH